MKMRIKFLTILLLLFFFNIILLYKYSQLANKLLKSDKLAAEYSKTLKESIYLKSHIISGKLIDEEAILNSTLVFGLDTIKLKGILKGKKRNTVFRMFLNECEACQNTELLYILEYARNKKQENVIVLTNVSRKDAKWLNIKFNNFFTMYQIGRWPLHNFDSLKKSYKMSFNTNSELTDIAFINMSL